MGGFFELRDPSLPGGAASSGPSRRVVIVDGSEELARWLLGLATPPPGVLFLRGRDASVRQEDRSSCAVGASYLPIAGDITLGEWVARAAKAAEREPFTPDDAMAILDELGLRFLARTALANVPADLRPRASLAAALSSNRPILVADASTGFGMLDRDRLEAAQWDRWCAGRDVVLFVPRGTAVAPFLETNWVVVGEAVPDAAALRAAWRLDTSGSPGDVARHLEAAGVRCALLDGCLYVLRDRDGGPSLATVAAVLRRHSVRLREAVATTSPVGSSAALDA